MMDTRNIITDNLRDTHELERLYREDPETFRTSFDEALRQFPDSEILSVWKERLYYEETLEKERPSRIPHDFIVMGILALLAGSSTRILMHFIERESISPVNLIFGQLPFIAAYFVYSNKSGRKVIATLLSLFAVTVLYMNALPLEQSDSIILAYLHLPVFLWVMAGLAFTGNDYEEGTLRLAFLRFNGEFAILYAAMAISGILLSLLTMQLFTFVGMDISEFYFENVVLFGAAALSVVASHLITKNLRLARNLAPYIARIFSPLVLVTLAAYLLTVVIVGKNPFLDRNFLLSFNGILLLVLVVTIFSITESGRNDRKGISDYINLALIGLALLIDGVALSAIIFRLTSYGITPNRIAVLGVNLLICANLLWIMSSYLKFLKDKTGPSVIQDAVTKYLPLYGLWAAFVTFTFPMIFR